jgi:hypothetical protein
MFSFLLLRFTNVRYSNTTYRFNSPSIHLDIETERDKELRQIQLLIKATGLSST